MAMCRAQTGCNLQPGAVATLAFGISFRLFTVTSNLVHLCAWQRHSKPLIVIIVPMSVKYCVQLYLGGGGSLLHVCAQQPHSQCVILRNELCL